MLLPFVRELTQGDNPFLATEATREPAETHDWQVQEIQTALAESDAGDFASDSGVKEFMHNSHGNSD